MQWIADESYKDFDFKQSKSNGEASWNGGLIDVMEEEDDSRRKNAKEFGSSEDIDEAKLNAIPFRDYLETLPKEETQKSKNIVKVHHSAEGAIMGGDVCVRGCRFLMESLR